MKEIAAVWAQLERARSTFEDLPLPQVYGELTAARTQLLEILAADGDLPPDATHTSVSQDSPSGQGADGPATTTRATTTTLPREQMTTGQTTTGQTTTGQTTTGETTTTADPTTTTP
jgi:hypothetical protein